MFLNNLGGRHAHNSHDLYGESLNNFSTPFNPNLLGNQVIIIFHLNLRFDGGA
ncbi:hypothetical protein HOG98_09455 [bacterium]|nr:hypothetical protein [bacterium]